MLGSAYSPLLRRSGVGTLRTALVRCLLRMLVWGVGLDWAGLTTAFVYGVDSPHYSIPSRIGGDIISNTAQLTSGPRLTAPGEV